MLVETVKNRTIDIEHPDDLATTAHRDHDFRVARAIASDVTVELVDIVNELSSPLCHCRTTHPAADRDPHAGRFALKWPQYQGLALQQIKTDPVDLRQLLIK